MTANPSPTSPLDDRHRMVKRVAALLAKAASTDHEPERRAFEAKAQALITRWQIDDGELREASSGPIDQREIPVEGWGNATRGVVHLWSGVAELNRCSAASRSGRGWATVVLSGTDLDAELTTRLVEHLLPQLRLAILNDRPRSRMSYAVGWAHQVITRLREAQEQAAAEVGSALVPTNTAAADALAAAYQVRAGRKVTVRMEAYGSGARAGDDADLGGDRLPG